MVFGEVMQRAWRGRALGGVALVLGLCVSGLASARPGGGQVFVAPKASAAKPAPKAGTPSFPGAPTSPPSPTYPTPVAPKAGPTVDFWNGGEPPPELPPRSSAQPPPPEREVTPAAPGEEATRNGRNFAFAVLAGGAFFVLLALVRALRGRGDDEGAAAPQAAMIPLPPPPVAAPAPMTSSQDAYGAPPGQYGAGPMSQQGPQMAPPGQYGAGPMSQEAQYGAPQMAPQAQPRAPSMAPPGAYGAPSMPHPQHASVDSPQVGEMVGDKYRVDAVLGSDELGVTYGVTFATLGQSCRIYVLRLEFAGSAPHHQRMSEIARASAAAPQPGFQVFDVGQLHDGRPYLVIR